MARSFAQLARTAEKTKGSVAVPKEPLDHPPLQIHTLGNGVLRQSTRRIGKLDESVRDLVRDMLRSMYAAKGIGLAAPQVGFQKRIIVADVSKQDEERDPYQMVNPEVIWSSPEQFDYEEGCLSLPDQYADVSRPRLVRIRYLDRNGSSQIVEAEDLLAVCLQHEVDHLEGILFVDHITKLKRDLILRKLRKMKKLEKKAG